MLLQVVFAVIAPGQVVANLAAGAIAEAGAQQAGDMMQVSSEWHIDFCDRGKRRTTWLLSRQLLRDVTVYSGKNIIRCDKQHSSAILPYLGCQFSAHTNLVILREH